MATITRILTHPGGAHKDEFLACAVLLALHPVPIERREPTSADLEDADTAVVDVGHRHEPERHNFDHHQYPRDHTPTCSLSLVLRHLGCYEEARRACDWLEPAEWFDCRGPIATAAWLGVDREVLNRLVSPIDGTLLRRFARMETLTAGDPLWEIMRMIGADLVEYLNDLRERMAFYRSQAEWWNVDGSDGRRRVLFVPRTDPLPEEPSLGIERYIESLELEHEVLAVIYPDRRGPGYGMSRFQDHPGLDFSRLEGEPEVHFAHARGFLAKTSATGADRLRALLAQALV